ncbi:MAG: GDP-mannose 4,6-dehydratase [Candidatus Aminicenantales bacterium]
MNSKKKIFLTGGTGFVGQHLIRLLSSESSGYEIYTSCFPESTENWADFKAREGVKEVYYLDLRSEEDVFKVLNRIKPKWIFHLAAVSNVRCSWEKRREALETNLMGTFYLYEAARRIVPEARTLFISSSDVYGYLKPMKKAYREKDRAGVVNPYAFTKVSGELLSELYSKTENMDIVIARPFPHTGPGQSPDFVFSDWARQISLIEKKRTEQGEDGSGPVRESSSPIIQVGNIETQRDYSDVRDVVRAYLLLMQKGRTGEIYNVCSGKAVALKKILEILLSMSPCKIEVRTDPAKLRKADIPYLAGNNQKIREETGWKPQISLEKSLRDLLNDWRDKI